MCRHLELQLHFYFSSRLHIFHPAKFNDEALLVPFPFLFLVLSGFISLALGFNE